jgi:hypothetical protein
MGMAKINGEATISSPFTNAAGLMASDAMMRLGRLCAANQAAQLNREAEMDMKYDDYAATAAGRPVLPPRPVPKDKAVLTREFILNTVATVFDVDCALLDQPKRGRARIALARQVAMYLAHVGCGLSLTAVGRIFGRDRSTVAHACRRIEDARERVQFDRAVTMMEQTVRAIVKTSPALRRDLKLAEQGLIGEFFDKPQPDPKQPISHKTDLRETAA